MTALRMLMLVLILAPAVLVIDLVWLGIVMKGFYAQEIGSIMRRSGDALTPRWSAALLVYLLIPAGLILFVRPLLVEPATVWQALGWGAAFGLVLYGVYDMTNLAVLENWTWKVAIADIAWGGVLCGITTLLMQTADRWLPK